MNLVGQTSKSVKNWLQESILYLYKSKNQVDLDDLHILKIGLSNGWEFPKTFREAFTARFSARFSPKSSTRSSTRFSTLDADWLDPHHPFQMLDSHQSIPFINRFVPSTISARFSASISARFSALDADWLAPHHPIPMLDVHQSLPC